VVTNNFGCTASSTVTVTEAAQLSPQVSGDLNICPGQTTQLDAGAGFDTYLWTGGNGGTTRFFVALGPGSYSVSVTLGNCFGTTTVQVVENTPPAPIISGGLQICPVNGQTTLTTTQPFVGYEWITPVVGAPVVLTSSLVVTQTGDYTVRVTDAEGCIGIATVTVTAFPPPQPQITGSLSFCPNGQTTLASSLPFASYQWSTGSTSQSIQVNTEGSVTLTVTDGNGCTGSTTVSVVQDDNLRPNLVTVGGDTRLCPGETVIIDAGTGFDTYTWSNGLTGQTITVADTGTYQVTVGLLGNCTGTGNIRIERAEVPNPVISGRTTACLPDSILLTVSGRPTDSYVWEPGSVVGDTFVAKFSVTYTVTATSADGCTSTATYSVVLTPTPDLGLVVLNDSRCPSESGTLTVLGTEPGVSYTLIRGNRPLGSPIAGTGGDLDFTIPDSLLSDSLDRFSIRAQSTSNPDCGGLLILQPEIVTNPLPDPSFTVTPTPVIATQPALLSGLAQRNATYQWFVEGQRIQTDTLPRLTYTFALPGKYDVVLVVETECIDSLRQTIQVVSPPIEVPNVFTPNGDGANDVFKITGLLEPQKFECHVYDRWGVQVWQTTDYQQGWDGKSANANVPDGVYYYTLRITLYDGTPYLKTSSLTLVR
jgi:gliding motility-associated-like protein